MCPQGVCWKMWDLISLTTNHTGCGILWALIALKSISLRKLSHPHWVIWHDMLCKSAVLDLTDSLVSKWEKIPAAMFHHLVKNLPRNLEVVSTTKEKQTPYWCPWFWNEIFSPHTFGCCLCWYEEGTKYWTMRYPSSWCYSDNLSLHKLLFHKLLFMLKEYFATLTSVITN